MPVIPKGLLQAYAAQDSASEAIQSLRSILNQPGHTPTCEELNTLAALISAWDKAQERVRIHRRVPLPGTARPPAAGKRKVARPAPVNAHPSAPQPQPPSDVA